MRAVIFALLAHVALANNNTTESSSSEVNTTTSTTTTTAPNTTTTTTLPNTTTTSTTTTTTLANTTTTTTLANTTTTTTTAAKSNTTTAPNTTKAPALAGKVAPKKDKTKKYDEFSQVISVSATLKEKKTDIDSGFEKMLKMNVLQCANEVGLCKMINALSLVAQKSVQQCTRCSKDGVVGFCYTMKAPTADKLKDTCMKFNTDSMYFDAGTCKTTVAKGGRRLAATDVEVKAELKSDMKAVLVQSANATVKYTTATMKTLLTTTAKTTFIKASLQKSITDCVAGINAGDVSSLGLPKAGKGSTGGAIMGTPTSTLAAEKKKKNITLAAGTVTASDAKATDAPAAATTASAVTAGVSMAALLATAALF